MYQINKITKHKIENVSENMIGCLCWFGDRETLGHKKLGILKAIIIKGVNRTYYVDDLGNWYRVCYLAKSEENNSHNIGEQNAR